MDFPHNSHYEFSPHSLSLMPVDSTTSSYTSSSCMSSATPEHPSKPTTIPMNFTQDIVNASPDLKRFQQDLLILTSFNDNSSLHWRPSWFPQDVYAKTFWTLHNPPDVVTELLPHAPRGRLVYSRRMRIPSDPLPIHIKTTEHWNHVCDLQGVPRDYLCERHIELMRLGLPRDAQGRLTAPPTHPLYPEPQPQGHGRYILSPDVYKSHLPRKFQTLPDPSSPLLEDSHVVVVHSNGRLAIEPRGEYFLHESQFTHFNGTGGYTADVHYLPDMGCPKDQSKGRRWSWVPWTREMGDSCQLVVKLKVGVPERRKKLMVKLKFD